MKPGDLLRVRNKIQVGVVRVYTDDQCDSWEIHMEKNEIVCLLEEYQNQWSQNVLKVLFPRGVRWVYRLDMEILNETR